MVAKIDFYFWKGRLRKIKMDFFCSKRRFAFHATQRSGLAGSGLGGMELSRWRKNGLMRIRTHDLQKRQLKFYHSAITRLASRRTYLGTDDSEYTTNHQPPTTNHHHRLKNGSLFDRLSCSRSKFSRERATPTPIIAFILFSVSFLASLYPLALLAFLFLLLNLPAFALPSSYPFL